MSVNFFPTKCTTYTQALRFGLCDEEENPPAYLDSGADPTKWIMTVNNPENHKVTFVAVDHCIENKRSNGEQESQCDCLLAYSDTILLIELKNGRKGWASKGLGQVEKTIEAFLKSKDAKTFNKRRAYVANKRKIKGINVRQSDKEGRERIRKRTGFVCRFLAEITL